MINGQTISRSFVRSALTLAVCIFATAVVLLPVAMQQSGSGGPIGLAGAAAICLASGCAAEAISGPLARAGSPLVALLLAMMVRTMPPLVLCLILAARGNDGRQHLALIGYLLAFYVVTLAMETWLAVKRVSGPLSD